MKSVSFNSGWTYEPGLGGSIFARGNDAVEPIAVTLPHDAVIHMKRIPDAPSSTNKGFYPNGPFLYKKTFRVPEEWADKRVSVEFEGAYMNARVYINGDFAGQCPNGYAGFEIYCNDLLLYGEDNVIEVKLHTDMDSRWYSGAGLYRNVNLYVADQVHVAQWRKTHHAGRRQSCGLRSGRDRAGERGRHPPNSGCVHRAHGRGGKRRMR